MIEIQVEHTTMLAVQRALKDKDAKAPSVMKQALNATAKQARKSLSTQAQKTYVMKTGRFNKAMTIDNATNANLSAVVAATGGVTELKDFKVSPATMATGKDRPSIVKGKGLRANGMKSLQKGDLKAFITRFKSGHVSVVQRRGDERLPLKIFYSPAIPKMIGNEETVYGVVEPSIEKHLRDNLNFYIRKAMEVG